MFIYTPAPLFLAGSLAGQASSVLNDPLILFVFFLVGIVGLYLELAHPGAIAPGITGIICMFLFLLGAEQLSPNWLGSLFIVAGFAILVLETQMPTHGALTFTGLLSLAAGTFIFFDTTNSAIYISPFILFASFGALGIGLLYLVRAMVRSRGFPVNTGKEGLIGATGVAITEINPTGRIRIWSEDWAARDVLNKGPIVPGDQVVILGIQGLELQVTKAI